MGDAFKCKNCGTVVETLQSCPSCGEAAMQPIQSSEDSDVVSDIGGASDTDASDTDESSTAEPNESEPAGTADPDTASGRRDTTGREPRSESGLLSWLKSLF
jgi:predicted  nucleic acid-binding Zn-ribbon protein